VNRLVEYIRVSEDLIGEIASL